MVNRVIRAGHCTWDTVAIATQGKPMARMRLATNSVWRDANGDRQEAVEYHSIVLFGRISEVALQYAVKGRAVYVEGRLRTREFTDGDGNRRFSTKVVAETVKLLGGGRRDEADGVPDAEPEPAGEPVTGRRTTRRKAA
jgi:single-strand DNA-binding protein